MKYSYYISKQDFATLAFRTYFRQLPLRGTAMVLDTAVMAAASTPTERMTEMTHNVGLAYVQKHVSALCCVGCRLDAA